MLLPLWRSDIGNSNTQRTTASFITAIYSRFCTTPTLQYKFGTPMYRYNTK